MEVEALFDLFIRARERMGPPVVEVSGRHVAVGDLHGDLESLEAVMREWEPPYLFLGDYVDRGDRGLEVLTGVLQLVLEGKAVALRGNHESPLMNMDGGFVDELCEKVGNRCGRLYREVEALFAKMPLAALVDGSVLALHGGLPYRHDMTPAGLDEIRKVGPDLELPRDPIAFQVLWNDPCDCEDYMPSPRGPGAWLFGRRATRQYAQAGIRLVVRGHTYVREGCATHHGGAVLTVFSSQAGPYRRTRPKVALLDGGNAKVFGLYDKSESQCRELRTLPG